MSGSRPEGDVGVIARRPTDDLDALDDDRIYDLCRFVVGDPALAAEITRSVHAELAISTGELAEPTVDAFAARRAVEAVAGTTPPPPCWPATDRPVVDEGRRRIGAIIATWTPAERALFTLRARHARTCSWTAAAIGCTEDEVAEVMDRLVAGLRAELGPVVDDATPMRAALPPFAAPADIAEQPDGDRARTRTTITADRSPRRIAITLIIVGVVLAIVGGWAIANRSLDATPDGGRSPVILAPTPQPVTPPAPAPAPAASTEASTTTLAPAAVDDAGTGAATDQAARVVILRP